MHEPTYESLFTSIQKYISSQYPNLFSHRPEEVKERIKIYCRAYCADHDIPCKEDMLSRLYRDLVEFDSFTPYLHDENVEEINLNCWNDAKVTYADGRTVPIPLSFPDEEAAKNIIQRMLQISKQVLDNSNPIIRTHLGTKKRISVLDGANLTTGDGVAASIRIVNPKKLVKKDFIANGTGSEEMLEFLQTAYRYGASICCAGATGSGKTTLIAWLLSQMPDDKRIFTIEEGVQEFNLRRCGAAGNAVNNVVQTVTRESDDLRYVVSMEDLLIQGLTFNPDYMMISETKSNEAAKKIIEAANTGHSLITTVHANSCAAVYFRFMYLCADGSIDSGLLYTMAVEAFPITLYMKKLEDNTRRIMEINEAVTLPDGKKVMRTLYRYNVTENAVDKAGKIQIEGRFEKVHNISGHLQAKLRANGIPAAALEALLKGGKNDDIPGYNDVSLYGDRHFAIV